MEQLYLDTISGATKGAGPAILRAALSVVEIPYKGAMGLRNALFDAGVKKAVDLRRWTLSVGNITAGGTGKTPVVRWLTQRLIADDITPAVLTRGYVKGTGELSDEADLLTRALQPRGVVQVGADRVASAARVLSERPDVNLFVLDDGFQHRRARRDFDLVLINAADAFGHGHVHPRGLLRESIAGLRRADAILLTHAGRAGESRVGEVTKAIEAAAPGVSIARCDHVLSSLRSAACPLSDAPDALLDSLNDARFFAIAGIGHPAGFQATLARFGEGFVGHHWFGDHHHYTDSDIRAVVEEARAVNATAMVTTEKDWSKLMWIPSVLHSQIPFFRADVGISFADGQEQSLYERIVSRYRQA